jgi:photosystem II stability/assembly factor-like uncharacterized protein
VCAEERRELSLPAAAGGLKTMGYGRMATHRPGGVLPGGHSPSTLEDLSGGKIWAKQVTTAGANRESLPQGHGEGLRVMDGILRERM